MGTNEARYGVSQQVPVQADSTHVDMKQRTHLPDTFQMTHAGQSELFQVAQCTITVVPWTYLVHFPLSTVTAFADQHLLITSLIVFLALFIFCVLSIRSWGIVRY